MTLMAKRIGAFSRLLTGGLVLALLGGCGGGGGGGGVDGDASVTGVSTTDTGTVGLFLTDNPISDGTIKAVCVTYEQVELLGKSRVTLYDDGPRGPFDLLKLRSHSRPLAFRQDVPAGVYQKIRLTLVPNGIELKLDKADCTPGGDSAFPKLPGNRKLDFVVKGGVVVEPGGKAFFQLDMDAEKAIHVVDKGRKSYQFRPVVFVEQLRRLYPGKLVRIVGTIRNPSLDERSFLLCDADLPHHAGKNEAREDGNREDDDHEDDHYQDHGCYKVKVSKDDSFFDETGTPRPLMELLQAQGRTATVTGELRAVSLPDIPHQELPEPGECRLWDPKLPDGQQSSPGSCEDLWEQVDNGEYLIHHDDEDETTVVVDAVVIGLGETLLLGGTVTSEPGGDPPTFEMDVTDGPIDTTLVKLPVVIQEDTVDANGTRIFAVTGHGALVKDPPAPPQITETCPVRVDGVLTLLVGDSTEMRSELILLPPCDSSPLADLSRLRGTISNVAPLPDAVSFELVLDPDDPDNKALLDDGLSSVMVVADTDTRILLVTVGDSELNTVTEPLERWELADFDGQNVPVDVYAEHKVFEGYWKADTIALFVSSTP